MSKLSESSKLLGASSPDTKNFYFLNRTNSKTEDSEGNGLELPQSNISSSSPQSNNIIVQQSEIPNHDEEIGDTTNSNLFSWLSSWFRSNIRNRNGYQSIGALPRKIPVKVEPKVFFANERTFLAWLHMAVTLASISMAIIAFAEANAISKLYGVLLMPVAIAFCVYALWMYTKRAGMIRRKEAGPYEDKVGPVVLASLLALSIVVNFLVKIYDLAT